MLGRFGVAVQLQVATTRHPRHPAVRCTVDASPLRVHFSPWRYQHIMTLLNSIKGGEAPFGGAAAGDGAGEGRCPVAGVSGCVV